MTLRTYDLTDRAGSGWTFEWGVGPMWNRRHELLFLFRAAGFRNVRAPLFPDSDIGPDDVQLSSHWLIGDGPGDKDWPGWIDDMAGAGCKFNWLIGAPVEAAYSPWFGALSDRVETVARRWASATVSVECPNEYDISGDAIDPWQDSMRTLMEELKFEWTAKGLSPWKPILGPSLVNAGSPALLGDVTGLCDQVCSHPYSGNKVYLAQWLVNERAKYNPTNGLVQGMTATEYGCDVTGPLDPGWNTITELQRAVLLVKQYLTMLRGGIQKAYVYKFAEPADIASGFQMLTVPVSGPIVQSNTYRAFSRLLNLADTMRQSQAPQALDFDLTGSVPSDMKTLDMQARDGSHLLFIWREAPLGVLPRTVGLAFPDHTRKITYDLIHGASARSSTFAAGYETALTVGDDPIAMRVMR